MRGEWKGESGGVEEVVGEAEGEAAGELEEDVGSIRGVGGFEFFEFFADFGDFGVFDAFGVCGEFAEKSERLAMRRGVLACGESELPLGEITSENERERERGGRGREPRCKGESGGSDERVEGEEGGGFVGKDGRESCVAIFGLDSGVRLRGRERERFFGGVEVVVVEKSERAGGFAERIGLLDLEGSFKGGILGKGFLGAWGGVGEVALGVGFWGGGEIEEGRAEVERDKGGVGLRGGGEEVFRSGFLGVKVGFCGAGEFTEEINFCWVGEFAVRFWGVGEGEVNFRSGGDVEDGEVGFCGAWDFAEEEVSFCGGGVRVGVTGLGNGEVRLRSGDSFHAEIFAFTIEAPLSRGIK
jgi:hypothetical protein